MKNPAILKAVTILTGASLFLGACAVDESINREASVQLEPMAVLPERSVGQEFHGLDKGEPTTMKIVAVDENFITMTRIEGPRKGCTWTRGIGQNYFAPSVSWENCGVSGDSTGTQEFTKSGNIWPLTLGSSESYKLTGKDQKNNWSTTRNCEVKAAVLVSLQDKQYPTYEVVCKDQWNKRTWYVSPELQRSIKFKRAHYKRGVEVNWVADLS